VNRLLTRTGGALILLILLAVLAAASHAHAFFDGADLELARWLQRLNLPAFRDVMVAISWIGYDWKPWVLTAVTVLALLLRGRQREAAFFPGGLGLGAGADQLLKLLVGRPRPAPSLVAVSRHHASESFPSGHVVFFVIYFGFLLFLTRRRLRPGGFRCALELLLSAPIALVGPSRVWLGAHWPSDVLGGYLLGGAVLLFLIAAVEAKSARPSR
jgi:membrane-associated phospholipid phosphatase